MKREDILMMEMELDLAKARPAAPIGSEKVWSGVTYVKTATGWKPKGKLKGLKPPENTQKRVPKLEDPSKMRMKRLENFANKAKDSQLEAALKDPDQDEAVKAAAKAELEKRKNGESSQDTKGKEHPQEIKDQLSGDLDEAKKKATLKEIKKTGLVIDGHKIFIVMNEGKTGYKTQGSKLVKLESKEGESLVDFKERIKSEGAEIFKKKEEEKEHPQKTKVKEELTNDLDEKKETEAGKIKQIQKTGIVVEGHKIFIYMNEDKTGYASKGFGIDMKSEEGESLTDFKGRIKEAMESKFLATTEVQEEEKEEEVPEIVQEEKEISEEERQKSSTEASMRGLRNAFLKEKTKDGSKRKNS